MNDSDQADAGAPQPIVVWDGAPKLQNPLLLVAFEGWFDAGECVTGALSWMRRRSEARRVCHIDPEEFFDFQESRPHIETTDEEERRIRWPEIECHVVPTSAAGSTPTAAIEPTRGSSSARCPNGTPNMPDTTTGLNPSGRPSPQCNHPDLTVLGLGQSQIGWLGPIPCLPIIRLVQEPRQEHR
ncbi:PAC2 family protein [Candidatus Poriferisodalis sp.]|uniref:PAC2 family protein n=1 Tax=Candidatus Poriferisodalis sp. TaxID=3101277 RepID=UPI003B029B18